MTIPILGPAEATDTQACYWSLGKGAPQWFACDVVRMYWRFAAERGVRPEVAFAQACHETGLGNYGGVIDKTYNNFCGLKTAAGGANDDPAAHTRFPTREVGVIAHLDHLAAYAGSPGYPRADTPDPRHFPSIVGRAPTVEALSGKWAPSSTYHLKIVQFLDGILAQTT